MTTLLRIEGSRLELECELTGAKERAELDRFRAREARSVELVQALRGAMLAQIDEALPFDEPRTEVGQQDGRLRPAWRSAYLRGQASYRFGPDRYPVFDQLGRPKPPQVCTDFLIDTLERAAGTYYRPRGDPPGRVVGQLDLRDVEGGPVRPASLFIEFAKARQDWFETMALPEAEQIPFRAERRLHAYLTRHADDFVPGDIVVIRGWTPWDVQEMHYHSFFIYERDPVSGLPILLAGNAGYPSLRVWITELLRTPRRSIRVRVRPRPEWLSGIVTAEAARPQAPPPIVGGPY